MTTTPPLPDGLDNWAAEEGMRSLTSAQRDMMIYAEVRKINGRVEKLYTDWYGDPAVGDGGYKKIVIADQTFIANLRSGTHAVRWLVGAVGIGNLVAWVWLVARTAAL